jgi:hypothetical protein
MTLLCHYSNYTRPLPLHAIFLRVVRSSSEYRVVVLWWLVSGLFGVCLATSVVEVRLNQGVLRASEVVVGRTSQRIGVGTGRRFGLADTRHIIKETPCLDRRVLSYFLLIGCLHNQVASHYLLTGWSLTDCPLTTVCLLSDTIDWQLTIWLTAHSLIVHWLLFTLWLLSDWLFTLQLLSDLQLTVHSGYLLTECLLILKGTHQLLFYADDVIYWVRK